MVEISEWCVVIWPKKRRLMPKSPVDPQEVYRHDCEDILRVLKKMADAAFDGLIGVVAIEKEE